MGVMKDNKGTKEDTITPFLTKLTGVQGFKDEEARPGKVPAGKYEKNKPAFDQIYRQKATHLAVDPVREQLYVGYPTLFRFDGKTGEFDTSFFPKGELGPKLSEHAIGPDGLLYLRYGGSSNGYHMFRLDPETLKPMPFKKEYVVEWLSKNPYIAQNLRGNYHLWPGPFKENELGAIFCGNSGNNGCFQTGMHVSPDGKLVTGLREVNPEWAKQQGHPEMAKQGMAGGSFLSVFDLDGKLLGVNVVGDTGNGSHGVAIDRDGNVYAGYGNVMPAGQDKLDGLAEMKVTKSSFGSLIKFRGQGGKYPLNVGTGAKVGKGQEMPGALWVYGGLSNLTGGNCSCHHARFYMDGSARIWICANQLCSIMVLDSNGNRVARLGRYGNPDDTDADLKAGKDGVRLVWPRAVAASETAMYVIDFGNRRILKAALSYAAEETVPAP
jgi:hypothetical protein